MDGRLSDKGSNGSGMQQQEAAAAAIESVSGTLKGLHLMSKGATIIKGFEEMNSLI